MKITQPAGWKREYIASEKIHRKPSGGIRLTNSDLGGARSNMYVLDI